MKITHILSAALLVTLALTSCSDDDLTGVAGSEVEIKALIGSDTRTEPYLKDASANIFCDGDIISLQSGSQSGMYVRDGGSWNAAPGSSKLRWTEPQMQFSAVYPSAARSASYTLPADQSSREGICSADYMTYQGTHNKSDGAVSLQMQRQTARVVVTPVIGDDLSDSGAHVTSLRIYADNTPGEAETIIAINPYAEAGSYTALAAPTTDGTAEDRTFLEINVSLSDGITKVYKVKGMHSLERAKSYNLRVKIGMDYAVIEDVTITPWVSEVIDGIEIPSGIITLKAPGTLTTAAIEQTLSGGDILSIEGPMNGSDLRVLREYLGCKYNIAEESTPCKLRYMDLSGVEFQPSSEPYCIYDGYNEEIENFIKSEGQIPDLAFYKLKSETPVYLFLGTKYFTKFTMILDCAFEQADLDYVEAEGIEGIFNLAFHGSTLRGIDLYNLQLIENQVFEDCLNLRSLELPEGVVNMYSNIVRNTPAMEYLYLPYSVTWAQPQSISTDNLKTLKIMTKPGDILPASDITLTKGGSDITGQHIDCDLYLCNERKDEVTEGNTWAGNTWKSITFVDGTTLKK